MKTDTLKTYQLVRQKLLAEKAQIEKRLRQINDALEVPTTSVASVAAIKLPRYGRKLKFAAKTGLRKGGKRYLSPAARAKIAAKVKARWAKVKAAGKNKL